MLQQYQSHIRSPYELGIPVMLLWVTWMTLTIFSRFCPRTRMLRWWHICNPCEILSPMNNLQVTCKRFLFLVVLTCRFWSWIWIPYWKMNPMSLISWDFEDFVFLAVVPCQGWLHIQVPHCILSRMTVFSFKYETVLLLAVGACSPFSSKFDRGGFIRIWVFSIFSSHCMGALIAYFGSPSEFESNEYNIGGRQWDFYF